MAKKRKKAQPVTMKHKNKYHVGTINGMDLLKHRSEGYKPLPCRTGKHMTEKDRPRKKIKFRDIDY